MIIPRESIDAGNSLINYCNVLSICNLCICSCVLGFDIANTNPSVFLIRFEAWAKLAQQWLVYAPLGIHLEPINKQFMLLVII